MGLNTCGQCGERWDNFHTCPNAPIMLGTVGPDAVNPAHYTALKPEPIDAIEGWGLGYHLGCVVKYLARAGKKTPDRLTDLKKARWYLDREIKAAEAAEKP